MILTLLFLLILSGIMFAVLPFPIAAMFSVLFASTAFWIALANIDNRKDTP